MVYVSPQPFVPLTTEQKQALADDVVEYYNLLYDAGLDDSSREVLLEHLVQAYHAAILPRYLDPRPTSGVQMSYTGSFPVTATKTLPEDAPPVTHVEVTF